MRSLLLGLALTASLVTACGEDRAAPAPAPTATPSPTAPSGPSAPEEPTVDAAFQAFARGEAAYPWSAPVAVLFGGEAATTLSAEQAATPRAWRRLCDDAGAGYAMRECPIDLLSYVEGPALLTTEAVQEPCSRPHGVEPADVGATQRVSLVAETGGSCLDYAAVELYVDDNAQVVAVNLLLGSP